MATLDDQLRRRGASDALSRIPSDGYRQAPAPDGSQSSPLNTEFGRNLTNTLSALPGAASVPGAMARVAGTAAGALGASAPAVSLAGRAVQAVAPYAPVAGGAAALMSASSPASSSPASPPAAVGAVAPSSTNPTDQRLAGGTQTTPGVGASAALSQVMPGVYQHGRGQYSDNPAGMGFKPGFTGQPTARNISLIDALTSNSTPTAAAADPGQPAGVPLVTAMDSGGYGLRDQSTLAERNARVSANSLLSARDRNPRTGVSPQDAQLAGFYRDREQSNSLANNLAVQGMRTSGDLAQAGMREQGLNRRSLVQSMLEQQKVDQAGEAQGYANRAAGQLEQLRATILSPTSTAQEKQQAQQALMAIQGKEPTNRFTVVPGGQQIDPVSQRAYNVPSSVLNNQTGQFVQQPGAAQDQPKFETGKIYIDGNGQRGRWDGSKFVPA